MLSTLFICVVLQSAVTALSFNNNGVLDLVHSRLEFDPRVIASKSQRLRNDLLSLSIEFGNIVDFLGDVGEPNAFSRQHIFNIVERVGRAPMLRLGGNTQDKSQYCVSCRDGTMVNVYNGTGPLATEATEVRYNADLFRVIAENLGPQQKYIFGLNFGSGNLTFAKTALQGALEHLDQYYIHSYELGNEVNLFGKYTAYRPKDWTVIDYGREILEWYSSLRSLAKVQFQFGSFVGPPIGFPDFNQVKLFTMGVPERADSVRSLSEHGYPNNVCTESAANATVLSYFLNHLQTVSFVSSFSGSIAAARAQGVEYHIGETGSAGCHGKAGVSDTFAAALWVLDYTLTAAAFGVDRIFFHNGKGKFLYNMWEPTDTILSNGTVTDRKQTRPSYYSMLLIADLLKGLRNPRISRIEQYDNVDIAHFAVIDGGELVQKMVIINTALYTGRDGERSKKIIDVAAVLGARLSVLRLTAPSSIAKSGMSWATQTVGDLGKIIGNETKEIVLNGVVTISASEAVICERDFK